MTSRNITDYIKNAVGTVFLLAGAFFVCSTLVSIRAVFADPLPMAPQPVAAPHSQRAGSAASRASTRTSPRTTQSTVSRATVATPNAAATGTRATQSRSIVSRGTTATARPTAQSAASRATGATTQTATRGVASRNIVSRGNTPATRTTARNVVARTATVPTTAGGVNTSRVSLSGTAIRGSTATSSNYTYLSNKLYTGNYSNIIDSTTGLISSEAYSNCMESYYACMDEICTARNAAQRRCACAGRVKSFAEAEAALEAANEELITVSGQLALLIATKGEGKDLSQAFMLTDAEKVMNCVSWQETTTKYGTSSKQAIEWCANHNIYGQNGANVSTCSQPEYCSSNGNKFGFDLKNIGSDSSDILANLKSWADAKEKTMTITTDNTQNLLNAFNNVSGVVNNLAGISGAYGSSDTTTDSLAQTWGYELFEYAHNNVCNRVLDSCFNGIYEACGAPPSGSSKCGNGASQCPYNYNSIISVNNSGDYELNFVTPNTGYSSSNSATCFGYTSASGDPYSSLRKPVADARRSIMQKYALDANADCDAYGEQLSTTAQNISYQKVAAQQALQQKRLEFYQQKQETRIAEARAAGTNFNECMSEILDCYETQANSNNTWSDARIKTYCAQIANVPHCYETMICNPSMAQFEAVIDRQDDTACVNSQDPAENTCRNVVTLNELLNGTGAIAADVEAIKTAIEAGQWTEQKNSAALREYCLQQAGVGEKSQEGSIRGWKRASK